MGYTCERRATFILDGEECAKAFMECCKEIEKRKDEQRDLLHLARSKNKNYSLFIYFIFFVYVLITDRQKAVASLV